MRRIKALGQNFLSNFLFISREIKFVNPVNSVILEVGGGDGRLSVRLAKYAKKLYIVEKDKYYADLLRNTFENVDNVEIINEDFMKVEPFGVDKIVGNIPYYLSSQITFRLLDWRFDEAYIMYQKEFAEKLMAVKNKSRISFFAQYYYDIYKLMIISRKYFSPPPKVDSMLLKLIPKNSSRLSSDEVEFINRMFQTKRKKLGKLIREEISGEKSLSELQKFLDKRVDELSNDDILFIARKLKKVN